MSTTSKNQNQNQADTSPWVRAQEILQTKPIKSFAITETETKSGNSNQWRVRTQGARSNARGVRRRRECLNVRDNGGSENPRMETKREFYFFCFPFWCGVETRKWYWVWALLLSVYICAILFSSERRRKEEKRWQKLQVVRERERGEREGPFLLNWFWPRVWNIYVFVSERPARAPQLPTGFQKISPW